MNLEIKQSHNKNQRRKVYENNDNPYSDGISCTAQMKTSCNFLVNHFILIG